MRYIDKGENEPSRDVLLGDRVETDTLDFGLRGEREEKGTSQLDARMYIEEWMERRD